jgi:hypothetical protein
MLGPMPAAHRRRRTATAVVFATLALAAVAQSEPPPAPMDHAGHGAHVRELGAAVMPFDLDATLHVFIKTPDGGEQVVIARDPTETTQVELVRRHLHALSIEFSLGRFDDPIAIHGPDMPGVDVLRASTGSMAIVYFDVPAGSLITYRTSDPEVVAAIHAWFDAQVADHGLDAVEGPVAGVMTQDAWRATYPGVPVPRAVQLP